MTVYKLLKMGDGSTKKVLKAIEKFDENDNSIYVKDFEGDPITELHFIYDQNNYILKEFELDENGEEVSKTLYKNNEKGQLLESRNYIDGELYERIEVIITDEGSLQSRYIEEEIVERITALRKDGSEKIEQLVNGEVVQTSITIYKTKPATHTVFDAEGKIISWSKHYLNEKDHWLKIEHFNAKDELISEQSRVIKKDKLISETLTDYIDSSYNYVSSYEYDEKGNMIHSEQKSPSGDLIYLEITKYDDEGRAIEMSSLDPLSSHAIGAGSEYMSTIVFEYDDE